VKRRFGHKFARIFIKLRTLQLCILLASFATTYAQLYELKDPSKDSANYQKLYDDLPEMCDSFYIMFVKQDIVGVKKFVPRVKFLRATFDTLSIEYREEQVVYRQQLLLRKLQKDYRKILKSAEKNKIIIKKIVRTVTDYAYGQDEDENRFCYVTVTCKRRKHEYELRYLAIILNSKWFVGDELSFEEI